MVARWPTRRTSWLVTVRVTLSLYRAGVPMMPGPGNELTPSVAGRGYQRASHADREHVVELLKAAFVQGRLTKEELEARAGKALGSRTYAELAELTFDLPAAQEPRQPDRATARRVPMGKVVLVGTGVLGPPAIRAAAVLTNSDALAKVFVLIFPWYFMGWLAAVLQIIDNSRKRSRGQLPPRPAQDDRELEGEQDGGTGNGLMLAEGRDDGRADRMPARRESMPGAHESTPGQRGSMPGQRGSRGGRRPLRMRPARRIPADLGGTA